MAVESCGFPIAFEITGGEAHDYKQAPSFIQSLPSAQYTVADKGYDSEELRQLIRDKSSIPVIPKKK